jgi:hypothetical protein
MYRGQHQRCANTQSQPLRACERTQQAHAHATGCCCARAMASSASALTTSSRNKFASRPRSSSTYARTYKKRRTHTRARDVTALLTLLTNNNTGYTHTRARESASVISHSQRQYTHLVSASEYARYLSILFSDACHTRGEWTDDDSLSPQHAFFSINEKYQHVCSTRVSIAPSLHRPPASSVAAVANLDTSVERRRSSADMKSHFLPACNVSLSPYTMPPVSMTSNSHSAQAA